MDRQADVSDRVGFKFQRHLRHKLNHTAARMAVSNTYTATINIKQCRLSRLAGVAICRPHCTSGVHQADYAEHQTVEVITQHNT
jgi:hypothetical protein